MEGGVYIFRGGISVWVLVFLVCIFFVLVGFLVVYFCLSLEI